MRKGYIYIGSNNETHELESDKAVDIIARHFEGFSAYEIIGFWKGLQERTLKHDPIYHRIYHYSIKLIIPYMTKKRL